MNVNEKKWEILVQLFPRVYHETIVLMLLPNLTFGIVAFQIVKALKKIKHILS